MSLAAGTCSPTLPRFVPEQVCREVEAHRPAAFTDPAIEVQRLSLAPSDSPLLRTVVRTLSLDLGEEAALCCMADRPRALFFTDDSVPSWSALTARTLCRP